MCLTIPKKVLEIRDGMVVVEDHKEHRQEMKTLIELAVGDFVLSQQNIIIEKMQKEDAENMLKLVLDIKNGKENI